MTIDVALLIVDRCINLLEEILLEFEDSDDDLGWDIKFGLNIKNLVDMKFRLKVDECRILVAGDVNCGKSSLINYLIRKESYLLVDEFPSTLDFKEISINIGYDKDIPPIFKNNSVLIDSPGLNCDIRKTMSILNEQGKIDIVIFVLTASNLFTQSSKEFIEAFGNGRRIFYVINKIDLINRIDRCSILLKEQLPNEDLYFVSLITGNGLKEMEKVLSFIIGESFSKIESFSSLLQEVINVFMEYFSFKFSKIELMIEKINDDISNTDDCINHLMKEKSSYIPYDLKFIENIIDSINIELDNIFVLWNSDILLMDIINYYLIYNKLERDIYSYCLNLYDDKIRCKCIEQFPNEGDSLMNSEELSAIINFYPILPRFKPIFEWTSSLTGVGIVILGTKCTLLMKKYIPYKYKGVFSTISMITILGGILIGKYKVLDKDLYIKAIKEHFNKRSPFILKIQSYLEVHFNRMLQIRERESKDECERMILTKMNDQVIARDKVDILNNIYKINKNREKAILDIKASLEVFCNE